ncbi:MAG: NAD-dependent epimerase/dehydratase family protein [Candidatus Eremiobacteraeota bacterium]|nr:NAD-dependent epimerase/dehydratase family protein [Candidatus Eremiobacteraeota bacterium]
MKTLILGGTTFLGRHLARMLVERGHQTAIFTRGREPGDQTLVLDRYVGERDGGLAAVPRDGWDAVIDTSGYVPAIVAASCAHLASAGRYLFTSSISVYDPTFPVHGDGHAPYTPRIADRPDDDPEKYGPSKRRSEDVVRAVFDERALLVRLGLLVGPYDPTNRFTYWVDRFAEGGDVVVPGPAERYVQFIDVRDAAAFMIRLLEDGRSGIYDVNGPLKTITMRALVKAAVETLQADANVVWVDERFLEMNGITGWVDLPLWLVPSHGMPGFMSTNIDRALADGLSLRPLDQTIRDTRAWSSTCSDCVSRESRAGITRERERDIRAAWIAG